MTTNNPGNAGGSDQRPTVPRTTFCLRLTLAYDLRHPDGDVRLVRVERVRATAPGIASAPPRPGQTGAWFEVKDAAGKFVYYQPLHDPMPTTVEVFADQAGRPSLQRAPRAPGSGELQVLVPDLPDAATFAFHASGVGPGHQRAGQPARALLEIGFDEIRKHVASTP